MPSFARFAGQAATWCGSPWAFALVLVLAAAGIVTGLRNVGDAANDVLLVLILAAQRREDAVARARVAELVRATPEADDALLDAEEAVMREEGAGGS